MLHAVDQQNEKMRQAVNKQSEEVLNAIRQQHENVARLNQMVVDLVWSSKHVLPEEFAPMLEELRGAWTRLVDGPRDQRTALAVLHGLAEKSAWLDLTRQAMAFFQRHLRLLQQGHLRADHVENEAARLGLPVCDTEETVEAVSARFGYVDTIEDHQARVILLDEQDQNSVVDLWVPIVWLPRAYREEDAGVAWVEREYPSGVKGRFEPASAGD
jgi:hypothetical protein